jgi:sugar lactone lactonase YvrE
MLERDNLRCVWRGVNSNGLAWAWARTMFHADTTTDRLTDVATGETKQPPRPHFPERATRRRGLATGPMARRSAWKEGMYWVTR